MSEDTAISTYNNNQTYKKHFCEVVQKHWRQEEKEKQRHMQLQSFLTNTQKQKKIFQISLFIDVLLKLTNKQLIIIGIQKGGWVE